MATAGDNCCVCPHLGTLPLLNARTRQAIRDPQSWLCVECGTTESIWACLQCVHFACGRDLGKHALQHFEKKKHPFVVEINTKSFYCYLCDDYVINDTSHGDLEALRTYLLEIEGHERAVCGPDNMEADISSSCSESESSAPTPRPPSASAASPRPATPATRRPAPPPPPLRALSTVGQGFEESGLVHMGRARHKDQLETSIAQYRKWLQLKVLRGWFRLINESRAEPSPAPSDAPPALAPPPSRSDSRAASPRPTRGRPLVSPSPSASAGSLVTAAAAAPGPTTAPTLGSDMLGATAPAATRARGSPAPSQMSTSATSKRVLPATVAVVDLSGVGQSGDLGTGAGAGAGAGRANRAAVLPGMAGLRNLGQTCFMNVVLQSWGHTSFFRLCLRQLREYTTPPTPISLPALARAASPALLARAPAVLRQTTIDLRSFIETPPAEMVRAAKRKALIAGMGGGVKGGQGPASSRAGEEGSSLVAPGAAGDGSEALVVLGEEIDKLFRVMWSGRWAVVTPYNALVAVWRLLPDFRGFKQQDAQELMMRLHDRLLEELRKTWAPASDPRGQHAPWPARVLMQAIEGAETHSVQCNQCKHVSAHTSPLADLALDLAALSDEARPSLEQLLARFSASEQLEGYRCDGCSGPAGSLRTATMSNKISSLPTLLRCHLNRWSGRREKIRTHVTFPLTINMRPFSEPTAAADAYDIIGERPGSDAFLFDLVAVIVHEGRGVGAGHYIAYSYNRVNDCWLCCNDTRVTTVTPDTVLAVQAYILFYAHRRTAAFVDSELLGGAVEPAKRARVDYIH